MQNENRDENNMNPEIDGLDEIAKLFRSIPKPEFQVVNKPKYQKMLLAAARLREIIYKENPNASVDVEVLKEFDIGSVTVRDISLEFLEPEKFAEAIKEADNIEIIPHTDFTVELCLTFHSVLISLR